jgi:hypothetical protein
VKPTDPSRRRLLAGLAGTPAAMVLAVTATRLGRHAALARPGGRGTSGQRCGQCGAFGHTMLSGSCPAAPQVV